VTKEKGKTATPKFGSKGSQRKRSVGMLSKDGPHNVDMWMCGGYMTTSTMREL